MGSWRKYFVMISLVLLSVVGLCTAGTVLEYKDEEKGIHHVQSGEPGVQVAGSFSFDSPEGEAYNLAYTAGEEGFLANGEHLPVVPKDTEDVAAARSSFLEAFQLAEEMAAAEMLEAEPQMVVDNDVAEVVVESLRRRRSPVTSPLTVSSDHPSYTYVYGNSKPLAYSAPLTYLTYPTYSSYPATYAVQYPYYTYPTYTQLAAQAEASLDEMSSDEMPQESQVPIVQPAVTLNHPVVRIGFQGLQPVQVGPVVGQPVQVQPAEPAEAADVANERILQEGDDEPAALAL